MGLRHAVLERSASGAMVFGDKELDLGRPRIMGILNVTPDSFSDGGQLFRNQKVDLDALLTRAETMLDSGADILDVGGESTRPGAEAITESEELDRVLPAIEALQHRFDTIISLDSSSPLAMSEAAGLGAGLLNDVRGFQRPGAIQAAAKSALPVCIMHMQGEPAGMQEAPTYTDVVADISRFFSDRLAACAQAGIDSSRILLDPGFGFGKSVHHNYEILARLREFQDLGRPLLVGLSRKSMIGQVLNRPADERVTASVALALMAVERGARIVRVHDVQPTADALAMLQAVTQEALQ